MAGRWTIEKIVDEMANGRESNRAAFLIEYIETAVGERDRTADPSGNNVLLDEIATAVEEYREAEERDED